MWNLQYEVDTPQFLLDLTETTFDMPTLNNQMSKRIMCFRIEFQIVTDIVQIITNLIFFRLAIVFIDLNFCREKRDKLVTLEGVILYAVLLKLYQSINVQNCRGINEWWEFKIKDELRESL